MIKLQMIWLGSVRSPRFQFEVTEIGPDLKRDLSFEVVLFDKTAAQVHLYRDSLNNVFIYLYNHNTF